MIHPILRNKLKTSLPIVGFLTLVGTTYELLDEGQVSLFGPMIGLSLGFALAILEEFIFPKYFLTQSFTTTVFIKTGVYLCIISFIFLSFSFFGGMAQGYNVDDFVTMVLLSGETYLKITVAGVGYLITIFFLQLNRLLGPGILLKFIGGHYHQPQVEQRVFMFLDLKSSTSIAESLGHYDYYSFLNDFIRHISDSVVTRSAQIYQYVGDEVVLTWKTSKGIEDWNCVNIFFGIKDQIEQARDHYLSKYKVIPEFKAGIHCGEVISAEIGDLKKDIVYNGDVLNTTSRIQGLCNQFESEILVSSDLFHLLPPTPSFQIQSMGSVELRGKAEPIELMRISRNGSTSQ